MNLPHHRGTPVQPGARLRKSYGQGMLSGSGPVRAAFLVWNRLEAAVREVFYWRWRFGSRHPAAISVTFDQRATVVICSYSPRRVRNLWPLARYLLACPFVARVVISNNNPGLKLTPPPELSSERLTVLNQPARRGPGFTWLLAADQPGDYFLCLDDDLLIYPSQLASLFRHLLDLPETPHGIAGKLNKRYRISVESEVDDLYTAYAVTRHHLETYKTYLDEMIANHSVDPDLIEYWADDIVISRTGPGRARIHDVGYVHLCPTSTSSGVATFRETGFRQKRPEVLAAVELVRGAQAAPPATSSPA